MPTVLHEIRFFCEQTRCFWYSSTHCTVSDRQLFCHFVTNSWLLRSDTQTHHLSPHVCVFVCEWRSLRTCEAHSFRFENSVMLLFFSLIQPWISSIEVITSNENKRDWLKRRYVLERQKYVWKTKTKTEFLRCGSFYFAVAVRHSQLHVAETLNKEFSTPWFSRRLPWY